MAELTRLEGAQIQRSDAYPLEFLHQETEVPEHIPDLAVAAFDEPHLIPRILGAPRQLEARRGSAPAAQRHSLAELLFLVARKHAVYFNQVNFRYMTSGGGEDIRKFAVIGHQQQA